MKLDTPEISWHGKEPILSIDFSKTGSTWRLASAGADNDVKVKQFDDRIFDCSFTKTMLYVLIFFVLGVPFKPLNVSYMIFIHRSGR